MAEQDPYKKAKKKNAGASKQGDKTRNSPDRYDPNFKDDGGKGDAGSSAKK